MAALNTTVHVYDDEGIPHIYGPGEIPPDWAIAKITNPDVWAEDDEDDDVIADPVIPTDHTPQAGNTPPANDSDNGGQGDGGDQQPGPGDAPAKPIDEWTVPQLRDYAQKAGIDLDGVTRRADILAAVKAAAAAPAPNGDAQA
ncbi:hypothetical protein IRT45_34475 [Nocardia sp. BSTN01]|uniref:hypothetical protein n=1 Tax=Nocardia sp. BSTN01 TaxID=2783665 RepID=UPI00188EDDC3|nr:hypothetical protein [Nocardia sp. BSTN01]MBF5002225.1 hypothetical protein [Nocardia sp. BSTN01]